MPRAGPGAPSAARGWSGVNGRCTRGGGCSAARAVPVPAFVRPSPRRGAVIVAVIVAVVAGELPCSAQVWVTQGREGSLGLSVRNGNMGERGQIPRGEQDLQGAPARSRLLLTQ